MSDPSTLSERERDVVRLVLQGMSNKQVAGALGISTSTVEFHLKNIYAKLGVRSRVELIVKLGAEPVGEGPVAPWTSVVEKERQVHQDPGGPAQSRWSKALETFASALRKGANMQDNTSAAGAATTGGPQTFYQSIRICLLKYADFAGRASRAEFWWFVLFIMLVGGALELISQPVSQVFLVAMLLPLLAAGTRRLRDSGESGWWQLFLLVPVGGLVLVGIMWAKPAATANVPLPA